MEQWSANYTRKDIGGIIEMVRLKMNMNMDGFASMLGIPTSTLLSAEEGNSMHTYSVIEKLIINKKTKHLFKINIAFEI